jgi:branched-chain amino acid aminotransferase
VLSREGEQAKLTFNSGTAAVITTVSRIGYLGKVINIPTQSDGMGPVSRVIWSEITGRQTGRIPSEWNVVVSE